ncbi:3689_t:CDS:2 [Ambispora gerdemannii]|uniref:Crossover junction endonuclease MUS81 n=1 Tax=Ambispora gerdemannii TaxID=144530 RepID=A0A9N8UY81_9GLOM|nr:3689_t:CDS:2 [Ambispora gerdemannii]
MPPRKQETPAPTCGNPLYKQWLEEMMEEAKAKNTNTYHTYKKACDSISKYPLGFTHPSEASILKGIGPGICAKLEKKLEEYCKQNRLPIPKKPAASPNANSKSKKRIIDHNNDTSEVIPNDSSKPKEEIIIDQSADAPEINEPPLKKQKKKPTYIPKYRSGSYAILLGLYLAHTKNPNSNGITKPELIKIAQQFCDSSFDMPQNPKHHYTAWGCMKTLQEKDLVYKDGCPHRFTLSEAGLEIAHQIVKTTNCVFIDLDVNAIQNVTSKNMPTNDIDNDMTNPITVTTNSDKKLSESSGCSSSASRSAFPPFTPVEWLPGTFEVILLIDNREKRMQQDRDYFQQQLQQRDINTQTRSLELGDMIWIARRNLEETVLGYIMERKRMDDLVMSIKDGRFKEQKFRLSKAGAKQVIYLIEDYNMEEAEKYGMQAIETAMSETQVINGFFLKRTKNIEQTVDYLAALTRRFKSKYESQSLFIIPNNVIFRNTFLDLKRYLAKLHPERSYHISYEMYSEINSKRASLTVRDTFVKMLMTIKGVSAEKALEIVKKYPTPFQFVKALECLLDENDQKKMLSDATSFEIGRKKIQPVLSGKIAHIWCADEY